MHPVTSQSIFFQILFVVVIGKPVSKNNSLETSDLFIDSASFTGWYCRILPGTSKDVVHREGTSYTIMKNIISQRKNCTISRLEITLFYRYWSPTVRYNLYCCVPPPSVYLISSLFYIKSVFICKHKPVHTVLPVVLRTDGNLKSNGLADNFSFQ